MGPNLYLNAEVFGGSDIEQTCVELCALATRLGLVAKASFNGVELMASPGADPSVLATNWDTELKSDHKFKIASARPSPTNPLNPEMG